MDFPKFKNDEEMAAWFEENNVDPADLDIAEVTIAKDLTVSIVGALYSFAPPGTSSATTASTVAGDRELVFS